MNQAERITLLADVNDTCSIRHKLALSVLGLGFLQVQGGDYLENAHFAEVHCGPHFGPILGRFREEITWKMSIF